MFLENTEAFPPAIPKVSMNIGLGSYCRYLNFDFWSFYDLATNAGATEDQINKLSIEFSDKRHNRYVGKYKRRKITVMRPQNHTATDIQIRPENINNYLSATEAANSTFRHETGHWNANIQNHPSEIRRKRAMALASAAGISGFSTVESIPLIMDTSSAAIASVPGGVIAGLALFTLVGRSYYPSLDRLDLPHEKFAYEFELANRMYTCIEYDPS